MSVQSQRGDVAADGRLGYGRGDFPPLGRGSAGRRQPHGQRPDPRADRHDEGHLDHVRARLGRHHPLYPGPLAAAEERQQPVQVNRASLGQPRQDLPYRPGARQRLGQQHGELPRPGVARSAARPVARAGSARSPSAGCVAGCRRRGCSRRLRTGTAAGGLSIGGHTSGTARSRIADRSSGAPSRACCIGMGNVQGVAGECGNCLHIHFYPPPPTFRVGRRPAPVWRHGRDSLEHCPPRAVAY